MRNVLRHGRLAPSFRRLVGLLTDTLPIVAELERMRMEAEKTGSNLDTFAKAAGWYRVLYGDLRYIPYSLVSEFVLTVPRHALDFRLMTEQRVAILDGSHSLFLSGEVPSGSGADRTTFSIGGHERDSTLTLQPIAGFNEIVQDAVREVITFGTPGKVVPVDVGVICDASTVRAMGRAIHDRVLLRLNA